MRKRLFARRDEVASERGAKHRTPYLLLLPSALTLILMFTACSGPRAAERSEVRRDAYYHRMITSGQNAFLRGDISRAAELYENALSRAQIMDRPAAIGASAYNLALCRIALGEWVAGRDLLREARIELRRAGESGVDTLIAEAEVAHQMGDVEAARTLSDEAAQALEGLRAHEMRMQLHSLRALMALERADAEAATEELALAERQKRRDTPLRLLARLEEVRGRRLLADEEPRLAAQAFDLETMYYRNEGRFSDMARAMTRAADAYRDANEHAFAADRYYRVARHYAADGQPVAGLRFVERALRSLEEIDDAELARRVALLFEELSAAVKKMEE